MNNNEISGKFLNFSKLNTISNLSFSTVTGEAAIPVTDSLSKTVRISYTIVFAILMAISANAFVYLPFTPIPITMQVMTVLLSAIALGSKLALLSQVQYVLAGLIGVPVFAGFKSGFSVITGPTGGYIIGFIAAAFVTGYLFEKNKIGKFAKFFSLKSLKKSTEPYDGRTVSMFVSCVIGLLIIYACGFVYLYSFIYLTSSSAGLFVILEKTSKLGVVPFIIIDFLKIFMIINLDKIFAIRLTFLKNRETHS